MANNFDFLVIFEDTLTEQHVPYDLRIFVNNVLRINERNNIDLSHQPITRSIKNTSTRPQHIRIDIITPCGAFNRDFIFDPAFCVLR